KRAPQFRRGRAIATIADLEQPAALRAVVQNFGDFVSLPARRLEANQHRLRHDCRVRCSPFTLKPGVWKSAGARYPEFRKDSPAFVCWRPESARPISNCSAGITDSPERQVMNSWAR